MAVKISQCGAWRGKIPDLGEGSVFDPRDNFVVLIEEFGDWDEEEIVGEGAESGELKSISQQRRKAQGKGNLTPKSRKSEILMSECFGRVGYR